ncbi:hypothetical protein [Rhizobium leguminosarum]|uniref:ATP dependent DNA ligase n=1 Tax=Rhizobium leguminosarum TaxID=384 RepID=UPI003F98EBEF
MSFRVSPSSPAKFRKASSTSSSIETAAAFGGIGRLLLAARKGNELVYVGEWGPASTNVPPPSSREQMDKLTISKPAVDTGRKRNVVFVDPKLVAEIEYRAWTHDGKLRHASYKGLRDGRTSPR